MSAIWGSYVVGQNQLTGKGDQQKHFISKSTLIYSDVMCRVRFNSMNNIDVVILPDTWYEFKSNIHMVFFAPIDAPDIGKNLHLYFEGVMVEEGRRPE